MKILRIKPEFIDREMADLERIALVLAQQGYVSTPEQCQLLWEMYSDSLCAGWLFLPESDEDLFEAVRCFIIEDDD